MANIKIYKDEAAGLVFFEGSTVNPIPCNVPTVQAHPTESDRIIIKRTDKFIKGTTDFRVLFKRLPIRRVEDEQGNQISTTDRDAVIAYLETQFSLAAATDVNAAYKGTWDAETNTPTISGSHSASGDWFFVGASGSVDPNDVGGVTGSTLFRVNDIVKFVSSSNFYGWQHLPNETVRVDQLRSEVTDLVGGRYFLGYVENEGEMNLLSASNYQYVVREDTNLIYQYSGSAWESTEITASLGIIGELDERLQSTEATASALTFDTNYSLLNTNTAV